jgi:hypothetical protein
LPVFGIVWLRNGVPVANEISVLDDEAKVIADAKRRALHISREHPGREPDSFRIADPTGKIRGVFRMR